jgi:hypothetical protein
MLDDTGHETLAGNHTFYGLGGICLRASHNEAQLWPAWRSLRSLVNGDPDIPLHAFEFGQEARKRSDLYEPMSQFFREHRFVRLAVTATVKTTYPDHLALMQSVILVLKKQMAEIAALSDCGSVAVVFESSSRADDALMQHFGTLVVERNGSNVPVEHCLMEETQRAGLGGRGLRCKFRRQHGSVEAGGKQGFPRDFASIFHSVPRLYVRYMDISSVFGEEQYELMLAHELK